MKELSEAGYLLRSIKDITKEIKAAETEIEKIKTKTLNITQKLKPINVHASLPADPMGDALAAIDIYETMLKDFYEELFEAKAKALATIKRLPYSYQLPLILYYLQDNTMDETAERLGVSTRQGWNKLKQSEKEFEIAYSC